MLECQLLASFSRVAGVSQAQLPSLSEETQSPDDPLPQTIYREETGMCCLVLVDPYISSAVALLA